MPTPYQQIMASGQALTGQDIPSPLTPYQQSMQKTIDGENYAGECQKYVEQQIYGKTNIFPSAIDAANYYANKGMLNPDISQAKPGSLVYFSANDGNGNNGHVGILNNIGNNDATFTSATYNGVQTLPLSQWTQNTGQQILGFVNP